MSSVREDIAKEIAIIRGLSAWERLPFKQTKLCGANCQEACLRSADKILSHPRIGIISEDQSLPNSSHYHNWAKTVAELREKQVLDEGLSVEDFEIMVRSSDRVLGFNVAVREYTNFKRIEVD